MAKYWLGVVSRAHVQRGKQGGFAQVCHGKQAPLQRMQPGDWLIYYSPTEIFGEKTPCRKFTALGQVLERAPYQVQMSPDFSPWRRDIAYQVTTDVAIEPLIPLLSFIKNKSSWGYVFRFGLFAIPATDFKLIAAQMLLKND